MTSFSRSRSCEQLRSMTGFVIAQSAVLENSSNGACQWRPECSCTHVSSQIWLFVFFYFVNSLWFLVCLVHFNFFEPDFSKWISKCSSENYHNHHGNRDFTYSSETQRYLAVPRFGIWRRPCGTRVAWNTRWMRCCFSRYLNRLSLKKKNNKMKKKE